MYWTQLALRCHQMWWFQVTRPKNRFKATKVGPSSQITISNRFHAIFGLRIHGNKRTLNCFRKVVPSSLGSEANYSLCFGLLVIFWEQKNLFWWTLGKILVYLHCSGYIRQWMCQRWNDLSLFGSLDSARTTSLQSWIRKGSFWSHRQLQIWILIVFPSFWLIIQFWCKLCHMCR